MLEKIFIKTDLLNSYMSGKMRDIKQYTKNWLASLQTIIKQNAIMIATIIFFITGYLNGDLNYYFALGVILYGITSYREANKPKEQSKFDTIPMEIDIFKFGKGDNSISKILDDYIDDCFTRDVLFFRVNNIDYIPEKEEKKILNTLLDSVAANMSPYLKRKFDYYYGDGRTDIILARKCLIVVSMYVANNNKNIYK